MPLEDMDNMHSGDFVSKANNDLGQIREYFSTHLQGSIRLIFGGLVSLSLMIYLSWQLTLVTFLVTPIFLLITIFISKPLKDLAKARNEKLSEVNKQTQDALSGYVEVRTYNLKEKLGVKIKKNIDQSIKLLIKTARIEVFSNGFGMISRIIPAIALIAAGSIFAVKGIGNVTIGTIIALTNLSNAPLQLLFMWGSIVSNYKKAQGSSEGVMKILDYSEERTSGITKLSFNKDIPVISFKNVSFNYKKENIATKVINNISFEINKGDKIAFVGESGCGKSTILKLIAGFYAPNEGDIYFNNINIKDINLFELRKHLAIVDQDTYLYPGTIYENIACGAINNYNNVPLDLVIQSSKTANIDKYIDSLPDKYDTLALERGVRLSGGQKQRIAMARAYIRNSEILLLDEPTSALDLENEKIVQNQLENIMENKTSIIVAHRLTTIKDASLIFVIDKGKIIGTGNHKDLMSYKGKYYDLLNKQLDNESEA